MQPSLLRLLGAPDLPIKGWSGRRLRHPSIQPSSSLPRVQLQRATRLSSARSGRAWSLFAGVTVVSRRQSPQPASDRSRALLSSGQRLRVPRSRWFLSPESSLVSGLLLFHIPSIITFNLLSYFAIIIIIGHWEFVCIVNCCYDCSNRLLLLYKSKIMLNCTNHLFRKKENKIQLSKNK